jgi:hypothetical protein
MAALRRDWINQLVVTSGAPTRSIDHHFKGGKPTGAAALRHCARPRSLRPAAVAALDPDGSE